MCKILRQTQIIRIISYLRDTVHSCVGFLYTFHQFFTQSILMRSITVSHCAQNATRLFSCYANCWHAACIYICVDCEWPTRREPERRDAMNTLKPKLHKDGTVTYWSVYAQIWERRVAHVPDRELAAMETRDRERVQRHLQKHAA